MHSDVSNGKPAEPASGTLAGTAADASADGGADGRGTPPRDALAELRYLLLGPERQEIAAIKEEIARIEGVSPEEVGDVLPQALLYSEREAIDEAMVPVMEETLALSARRDPSKLGDVLFPVMGPAIRKAIREALASMMEAINVAIEHSVSPRAVQWRLESWRSGTPFPEIVFRHTMLYKVEQVFLIHRETGLLLQHASSNASGPVKDADIVSGMLTAIQDFVRDSFRTEAGDALDRLDVGDLTVMIEQGPTATVAGVVRGRPPEDLRQVFHAALSEIQRRHLVPLRSFSGDTTQFVTTKPALEGCLQFRANTPVAADGTAAPAVKPGFFARWNYAHWLLAVLAFGAIVWGTLEFVAYRRWEASLAQLRAEPGLVVTQAERGWFRSRIEGLRDPLARDPRAVMAAAGLEPAKVDGQWQPYLAMAPAFILTRARTALAPPAGVTLQMGDDGVLEARGSASHRWIAEARRTAAILPGVTRFEDDSLADLDLDQVERLRAQVQEYNVLFPEGESFPRADQRDTLGRLRADVVRLAAQAAPLGRAVAIEVRGHTDSSGTEALNRALSQWRAERVLGLLRASSLPANVRLITKGVATGDPLRPDTAEGRPWNRRVSLRVTIEDAHDLGGEARTPLY